MDDVTVLDTRMHGLAGITGAFVVSGRRRALVETGPKSTAANVLQALRDAGVDDLDYIVVTHIHLDHAGAAGTLARIFPSAQVVVHPVGAPHLADPTKLWKSASRIYGADMERLWGGVDPVDPGRIRAIGDGEELDLGGRRLTALETPGHAFHHHAFLDDATGTLFTGDALGVRLQDAGVVRPATPPPEFDLELCLKSITRIREMSPARLCLTHFGYADEGVRPLSVEEACDAAAEALQRWAQWVGEARRTTRDLDEAARLVAERARTAAEQQVGAEQLERMENTTSYWMNTWGYMRYLDKREQAAS